MESVKKQPFSIIRFIAVCFAFVFVFTWLYVYIPMLLGISGMGESMAVISANEKSLFSIGGILQSLGSTWMGVLICLIYGFFFLDARRILPLLLISLATVTFLSRLTLGEIIRIDPASFNSLFVFSQFAALSMPFLLLERYGSEGVSSWKEFFRGRFVIKNRLQIFTASLKPFFRELLWVILLLAIARLPMAFTEGAGYAFIGKYFIDTGIVFFYAFFITAILLFTASGDNEVTTLKDILIMTIMAFMALILVIGFAPLIISIIFFPIFSIFGQGALQASIVHAPGSAYFISFFSFKSFLFSGPSGLFHLAGFLLAVYSIVSSRMRKLQVDRIRLSIPTTAFFLIIIGLFGWVTAGHFTGPEKKPYLSAKETFNIKTDAGKVMAYKNKVITIRGLFRAVKIHDRLTGKQLAYIKLPLDIQYGNVSFNTGTPKIIGSSLFIPAYSKSFRDKSRWWYLSGYRISLEKNSLEKSWKIKTPKGIFPVAVMKSAGKILYLYNNKKTAVLSAYNINGKLLWKNNNLGSSEHTAYFSRGRVISKIDEFYRHFKEMGNNGIKTIQAAVKPSYLAWYYPGIAKYTVVDAGTGQTQINNQPLKQIIRSNTLISAGQGRFSLIGQKSKPAWTKKLHLDLSIGYYEDNHMIYGANKYALNAFLKKDGKKVWSFDMKQSSLFPHILHPGKESIYIARTDTYRNEITVMLVDKETGSIRARWHKDGYTMKDAWLGKDETLYLVLKHNKTIFKSLVIGLQFK